MYKRQALAFQPFEKLHPVGGLFRTGGRLGLSLIHILRQHEALRARLCGSSAGVHQIPEFFQGDGQRNFHKGVRAVLHAVAGDSGMGAPVRAGDEDVYKRQPCKRHGNRMPQGGGMD